MDEYEDFEDSIVLRVLEKDKGMSFIKSTDSHFIIKKATKAMIRFSDCGKQLAIFWEE